MDKMKLSTWWLISILASFILLACLLFLWKHMEELPVRTLQLTTQDEVDGYIHREWEERHREEASKAPLVKIPTGLFLQSLKFEGSSEVLLTGYVWQRYSKELQSLLVSYQDEKGFLHGEAGFILPEQVDSGDDIEPREIYRVQQKNGELLIGWYFEAKLRQKFDYLTYPFDHKTVWIRLWSKEFAGNIILTPDFKAYDATGVDDIFGIEKQIVLGGWKLDTTYFDYKTTCYDTNFGMDHYIGKRGFPELYYNVLIERKSGNAIIVHMLPLFLVATLLFSSLLTVTGKPELAGTFGFSTSGVLGACSALFFVIMLAHIQLREQFAGSGVAYLEYFYFLMYAALVFVAINTFAFSTGRGRALSFIYYRDNLMPKLLYWPTLLLCMVAISIYIILASDAAESAITYHAHTCLPAN